MPGSVGRPRSVIQQSRVVEGTTYESDLELGSNRSTSPYDGPMVPGQFCVTKSDDKQRRCVKARLHKRLFQQFGVARYKSRACKRPRDTD